jgi:hypothetical protein
MAVLVPVPHTVEVHLGPLQYRLDRGVSRRARRRGVDHDPLGEGVARVGDVLEVGDVLRAPAGVDHPQSVQVEPHRDRHEPVDDRAMQRRAEVDLRQERLVLFVMLRVVGTAVVEVFRVHGGVGDRIELVVAEHDLRRAGLDHRPHRRSVSS